MYIFMAEQIFSQETNPLRLKIRSKKRAGCAFPLISLVSRESFECGDFYSLQNMISWAKKTGLSIIQILPLNDLGKGRSPYSSVSAFAIDPIYISLKLLGLPQRSRSKFIKSCRINIGRVRELKISYLGQFFQKEWSKNLQKKLDRFLQDHADWLPTYAAFKVLYEKNDGEQWQNWSYGSQYSQDLPAEICQKHQQEYYFWAWTQMVASEQLHSTKQLFEQEGVFLKGDLPILTSGNSADVWSKPHFFNTGMTAGAPPDFFNADGQNWGFPVIEWQEMKKSSYSWWKQRLAWVNNFYHMYRIDHVLGMFRIWAIPPNAKSAKKGYFYPQKGVPREDFTKQKLVPEDYVKRGLIYEATPDHFVFYWDFWKEDSYQELPESIKAPLYPLSDKYLKEDESYWQKAGEDVLNNLMASSDLFPCVEDLGAVPSFVRDTIHYNHLIGIDVIRWTRSFEDGSYIPAKKYRENAVSTLSVHDTSIAAAWWHEIGPEEKKAFLQLLQLKEEPKKEKLAEEMLNFALQTNSQFSINLLHDFILETGFYSEKSNGELDILETPEKHRINTPGTPEDLNWGYRFPFFSEDLCERDSLNQKIFQMVEKANRI